VIADVPAVAATNVFTVNGTLDVSSDNIIAIEHQTAYVLIITQYGQGDSGTMEALNDDWASYTTTQVATSIKEFINGEASSIAGITFFNPPSQTLVYATSSGNEVTTTRITAGSNGNNAEATSADINGSWESFSFTGGADAAVNVAATGTVTGSNLSGTNTGDNSANSTYSNVDNTSDADKPVSTAQQTALDNQLPYGPYATATDAVADGVSLDHLYHNFASNEARKARPEMLTVAVIGDSIPGDGGRQDLDKWGDSFINFMQRYSRYAFDILSPSTRTAYVHAIGGTTSGGLISGSSGVFQLDEILALSPAPDACVIQIGANDVKQSVDIETTISNLRSITDSLVADGIPAYLMTVVAGDATETSLGAGYPAAIEAINDRYVLEFSRKIGVSIIDSRAAIEQSPGLIKDGGTLDGTHPTRNLNATLGRDLSRQMKWIEPDRDVWAEGTIITTDPYFVVDSGVLNVPSGVTASNALSLRDDGLEETGERWIDIDTTTDTSTLGSGDGAIAYAPVGGNNLNVWHNRSTALRIEVVEDTVTVHVEYTGSVQDTANEVAAAILASSEASALLTATAQGTGNDPVPAYSYMDVTEFRRDYPSIDEVGLLDTDYVRAMVEIRVTPGEDFDLSGSRLIMYSLSPFGIKSQSGAEPSANTALYEPLDEGGIITIITPWHLAGTDRKFYPRFYAGYHCKIRVARLVIQKKI
jgi:lysophospholipase L1-like esterase